jgi:hypothetical protein
MPPFNFAPAQMGFREMMHSHPTQEGGAMAEQPQGCGRVTGTVGVRPAREPETPENSASRKETTVSARVGQKAPDFEAPAYYRGAFTRVKLSDYLGKWVLVCFYPGDFTFV